jgi:hypothetical protein
MRFIFQVRGHALTVIVSGGAITVSKLNMCSVLYANLVTA